MDALISLSVISQQGRSLTNILKASLEGYRIKTKNTSKCYIKKLEWLHNIQLNPASSIIQIFCTPEQIQKAMNVLKLDSQIWGFI